MSRTPIAICGAGGFGREVRWLIEDVSSQNEEWGFVGFFDDDSSPRRVDSRFYLGSPDALNDWAGRLAVVFAVGNPVVKRRMIRRVNNPSLSFPTLIHPTCCLGIPAGSIGEGSIICAGVVITVDVEIGKHVILNLGCTVGHDSVIGDYSALMPAVNVSGEVVIGEAVFLGTGASVANRVEIGRETVVGAGAAVVKSLPAYCTAVGVPAKPVRVHGQDQKAP